MKDFTQIDLAKLKAAVNNVNQIGLELIEGYKPIRTVGVKKEDYMKTLCDTIEKLYTMEAQGLANDTILFYNEVFGEDEVADEEAGFTDDEGTGNDELVGEDAPVLTDEEVASGIVEEKEPDALDAASERRRKAFREVAAKAEKKERVRKVRDPNAPKKVGVPRTGAHVCDSIEKIANWTDEEITSPNRFVDRCLAQGGMTQEQILEAVKAVMAEKFPNMKIFQNKGYLNAHIRYREERGWVIATEEGGTLRLVDIILGKKPEPKPKKEAAPEPEVAEPAEQVAA